MNYREQDFADVYKDKPFDFIFDSVGGKVMSVTVIVSARLCSIVSNKVQQGDYAISCMHMIA